MVSRPGRHPFFGCAVAGMCREFEHPIRPVELRKGSRSYGSGRPDEAPAIDCRSHRDERCRTLLQREAHAEAGTAAPRIVSIRDDIDIAAGSPSRVAFAARRNQKLIFFGLTYIELAVQRATRKGLR